MQGGIIERFGSQRMVTPSWLSVAHVVSCISLNYKVSFCMSFNSLWKKTYNNVFSLWSLWTDEPCSGPNPLEMLLQEKEEIYISRMLLRVERVTMVNDRPITAILYVGHHIWVLLLWDDILFICKLNLPLRRIIGPIFFICI